MGTDDVHGRASAMTQSCETGPLGCYKATVNEPETIAAAQPLDRVWLSVAAGAAPTLERS
jgi:hypothetical protein